MTTPNKAQHTPGPWTAQINTGGTEVNHLVVGGKYVVADMADKDGLGAANAHLIAAAPELLAAMREMVTEARERNRAAGETVFNPAALEIALAAIAKAEGSES